jgi:hypothetical protein
VRRTVIAFEVDEAGRGGAILGGTPSVAVRVAGGWIAAVGLLMLGWAFRAAAA